MSDFPQVKDFNNVTITPLSKQSVGIHKAVLSAFSSLNWPTANTAVFIPFTVAVPTTIVKMMWGNGSTVSGNVDAGIYDSNGNKLVSTGSTAQAVVSVVQSVDTTDITLQQGLYYMALVADSTSATFRSNSAPNAAFLRAIGVYSVATSFPLPSSVTFAGTTLNLLPVLAATTRVLI